MKKILTIFIVTAMLLSLTACTTSSASDPTKDNSTEETSGENTGSDVDNNSEDDNTSKDNDSEDNTSEDDPLDTSEDDAYVRPVFDSPVAQRLEQVFENHGFIFISIEEMFYESDEELYTNRILNGVCASAENYKDDLSQYTGTIMNAYKANLEDVSQLKVSVWTCNTEEEARNYYKMRLNGFLSEITTMDAVEDIMGEAESEYYHMWTSIWYDTYERNYVTCYSGYGTYIEDTTVVTYLYYAASADNPAESIFYDVTDALGCGNPMDLAEQDYSLITIPGTLY